MNNISRTVREKPFGGNKKRKEKRGVRIVVRTEKYHTP